MADMRWPLRMREYVGLLNIVGCTNTIMDTLPMLKDRAEKAGVYERLEAARDELDSIFAAILRTVPAEKLIRIQMDMKHTMIRTKVEAPGINTISAEHHRYVPAELLNRLVDYVARSECYLCDKTEDEARHCPIKAMLEDALPHELEYTAPDGCCKWSGMTLGFAGVDR